MKIVTAPNKILTSPTKKVATFDEELKKLVREMEKTLERQHDPKGVGLAANQVGKDLSIAIIVLNGERTKAPQQPVFLALINPKITKFSGKNEEDYEGCLSVPDQYGLVERDQKIKVEAQDLKGERIEITAEGFLARIIQHEVDHLNGKLITGKVKGKLYTERELEMLFSPKT